MQPNNAPFHPGSGEPPLTPPNPNQSYEPVPPAFGPSQVFMPQQPSVQQFADQSPYPPQQPTYPPQQSPYPPAQPLYSQPPAQPQPPVLDPFSLPVDRSQRPPSAFEQRFREYVVAAASTPQTAKPRKVWPIILIALVLLLGIGGAGAYAWYASQQKQQPLTAEERFTAALQHHLNVQYIEQDIAMKMDWHNDSSYSVDAHTLMDITSPAAPKLSGDFTYTSQSKTPSIAPYKVKFVTTNKKIGYYMVTAVDANSQTSALLNTWYKLDPSDSDTAVIDPLNTVNTIGTPTGEVIVGSFKEQERDRIIQQITNNNPYGIVSSTDEGDSVHYKVTIDSAKLAPLNQLVLTIIGDSSTNNDTKSTAVMNVDMWIDKATNHFTKVTSADGMGMTTTVTLSYPAHYSAAVPTSFKTKDDMLSATGARNGTTNTPATPAQ